MSLILISCLSTFQQLYICFSLKILHLLSNLGKVWNGILPVDIYCQSLGALFDDVLQSIAWEVLQLEVRQAHNEFGRVLIYAI